MPGAVRVLLLTLLGSVVLVAAVDPAVDRDLHLVRWVLTGALLVTCTVQVGRHLRSRARELRTGWADDRALLITTRSGETRPLPAGWTGSLLSIHLVAGTAGQLSRFDVFVDGERVARVRLGETVTVVRAAGPHTVSASIAQHRSEAVEVVLSDDRTVAVEIEYTYVVHEPARRQPHPFRITVHRRRPRLAP